MVPTIMSAVIELAPGGASSWQWSRKQEKRNVSINYVKVIYKIKARMKNEEI